MIASHNFPFEVLTRLFPNFDCSSGKQPWSLWHVSEIKSSRFRCIQLPIHVIIPRWRHQMEKFSALLALCAGNSPVTGEFPSQRPVTRSFDVFFDLGLNKRLSKQSWGWWFETLSHQLWHHCNDFDTLTGSTAGILISYGFSGWLCENGFAGGWPSIFYVYGR